MPALLIVAGSLISRQCVAAVICSSEHQLEEEVYRKRTGTRIFLPGITVLISHVASPFLWSSLVLFPGSWRNGVMPP